MKKIIKLTESDLTRIVKKIVNESKQITKELLDQLEEENLLNSRDIAVLKLHYLDNMSFNDIGEKFNISSSYVAQIVKKLNKKISDIDKLRDEVKIKSDKQSKEDKQNAIKKVKKEMLRVKYYLDSGNFTRNEIMSLFKEVLDSEEELRTFRY
jgi:predicted DNA-binding protein YlxM (UPF0122 family)